ncbi:MULTISPECIES: hypothetical protein [Actinoalloteichus]|uniref:hypothetical protein n=1 Tax=Actinoalloteichus TaxID=65496 RepID=UPI00047AAB4D|nr:hypothetical protein [Actinoalloteichus caeruleus]
MDSSTHSERTTGRVGRYKSTSREVPTRAGARRGATTGDRHDAVPPAEIAQEVGEAARQLGDQLGDPSAPHTLADVERIVEGLTGAVAGAAVGLDGLTHWLRSTGYGGDLSGHASAVAERLAHAGDDLAIFAEAVRKAAGGTE